MSVRRSLLVPACSGKSMSKSSAFCIVMPERKNKRSRRKEMLTGSSRDEVALDRRVGHLHVEAIAAAFVFPKDQGCCLMQISNICLGRVEAGHPSARPSTSACVALPLFRVAHWEKETVDGRQPQHQRLPFIQTHNENTAKVRCATGAASSRRQV